MKESLSDRAESTWRTAKGVLKRVCWPCACRVMRRHEYSCSCLFWSRVPGFDVHGQCYVLLVSSFWFSISGLLKLSPSQLLSLLILTSGIEVEKIGTQTEHLAVTIHKEICFKANLCISIALPFIRDKKQICVLFDTRICVYEIDGPILHKNSSCWIFDLKLGIWLTQAVLELRRLSEAQRWPWLWGQSELYNEFQSNLS